MRELAYIAQIKSLSPIPGADKIECAQILGFELVVKKNEFKVGDLCIYVEIDSILPELPCFEFLRSKKFRIRTIKIRQQLSQGIAFPLSLLTQVDPTFNLAKAKVELDVTDVLKITKYDPEVALDVIKPVAKKSWLERKLSYLRWKLFGFKPTKSGNFPQDVPQTDEVRVQKMGGALWMHQNELVYISEKCEGTSSTFTYRKNGNWLAELFGKAYSFQVCSRNRIVYNSQKGGETTHHIFKVAVKYNIRQKMQQLGRNLAFQGEVIGTKIQGNVYKLPGLELRIFSIFDIDTQKYLLFEEMAAILTALDLPMVPIIATNVALVNDIKHYVELSKGKSRVNPEILREGIVVRTMSGSLSFKSINPEYLLHQELLENK